MNNLDWKRMVFVVPGCTLIALLFLGGCSDSAGPGSCDTADDCQEGQVCDSDTGKCRDALTCANAGCADHQLCQEGSAGQDALCQAACEEGYRWVAESQTCQLITVRTCQPAPAEGSISQECADLGRDCVEDVAGEAECGSCLEANQIVDPDDGHCRAPILCDDIHCETEEICVQPPGQDAYCSNECLGPHGESGLVDEQGHCIVCPKCDNSVAGEDGPYLDSLTNSGECICRTKPGFYWSLAPIGVQPCDQDGDGWVRIGAQTSIEHGDPVIRADARCGLRRIQGYRLHNEEGQVREVALAQPAALYESKRNDDPSEIDGTDNKAPAYPDNRPLRAKELNSLTKVCVTTAADFNDNDLEDVDEYHGMTAAGMNPAYQPFLNFTYFVELHRGWYETGEAAGGTCQTPADCGNTAVCDVASGQCHSAGWYHVQEKSRAVDAPAGISIALVQEENAEKGPYWRTCMRKLDSAYKTSPSKQGMDYGQFAWIPGETDGTWHGMNHHSQFKCMKISGTPDQPNEVRANAADDYQFNTCTAAGSSDPIGGAGSANPDDPVLACAPVAADQLQDGNVRWAVLNYLHYAQNTCDEDTPAYDCTEHYIRGCVNECAELVESCPACLQTRESCPGYHDDPVKGQCIDITSDFGRLFCACGEHYAGAECQHACPGLDLMKDPNFHLFDVATEKRTGYWMCGHISSTGYPAGDPQLTGTNSLGETYSLRGEVPIAPISGERMVDELGEYAVQRGAEKPRKKPVYTIRPAGGSYRVR